ncbi:hypothetical protein AVEN_27950-1 [Araneus ventricosus]|uniref:Uncharacterized protein n=1 Tax=Araneus ventricosus TaxID=182803 RepID=A0A4Y2R6G7_ARAVE|nr:hypothetical protein AVEN_27950-1 [Araneus ventricosus]
MPRSEATRRQFWDEPCNFEPRSDDEGITRVGAPSPNFRTTPTGGHMAAAYDLGCNRSHTWWIFGGIWFRTCNHPAPKPRSYHWATVPVYFI